MSIKLINIDFQALEQLDLSIIEILLYNQKCCYLKRKFDCGAYPYNYRCYASGMWNMEKSSIKQKLMTSDDVSYKKETSF